MSQKVDRDFAAELDEARKKLSERGRHVEAGDASGREDFGGLCNDLELPYSTLPTLAGRRWIKTEHFA